MNRINLFKWKRFECHVILMAVRWYLQYSLSYRDIVELLNERGVQVSHTTIRRWVHQFGPELDKRIRRYLKPSTDSYRVDETYIKVNGKWTYLYRSVDSKGQTVDFMLFSPHNQTPRVITVDKNPAYPPALQQLRDGTVIVQETLIR